MLGPLESSRRLPSLTWGRKQVQFPKRCVFWYLEFRTMDKVHKPSNSECYTASSEFFGLYCNLLVKDERYWALFYMPLYTFLHNSLNDVLQIANKMG
jgi:hypothetical protein